MKSKIRILLTQSYIQSALPQIQCNQMGHVGELISHVCLRADCKEQRAHCRKCNLTQHRQCVGEIQFMDEITLQVKSIDQASIKILHIIEQAIQKFQNVLKEYNSIKQFTQQYNEVPNLSNLNRVAGILNFYSQQKIEKILQGYEILNDLIKSHFMPQYTQIIQNQESNTNTNQNNVLDNNTTINSITNVNPISNTNLIPLPNNNSDSNVDNNINLNPLTNNNPGSNTNNCINPSPLPNNNSNSNTDNNINPNPLANINPDNNTTNFINTSPLPNNNPESNSDNGINPSLSINSNYQNQPHTFTNNTSKPNISTEPNNSINSRCILNTDINSANNDNTSQQYQQQVKQQENLNSVHASDKLDAIQFNKTGMIYLDNKQYVEALESFELAIVLDPDNPDYQNNKGFSLNKLDRDFESIQYFDKALEIVNSKPQIDRESKIFYIKNKALTLFRLRQLEDLLTIIDEGLKLDPKNKLFYQLKIQSLILSIQFTEALKVVDEAIQLDSNSNLLFYLKVGVILLSMNKVDDAIDNLCISNTILPSKQAYYLWGLSLEFQGKFEEAQVQMNLANKLEENSNSFLQNLVELLKPFNRK